MVTNRNNNILENHEKITLNKDDDIGGSHIPVTCMWQCISITIPLAKQVHLIVRFMHAFLFCFLP